MVLRGVFGRETKTNKGQRRREDEKKLCVFLFELDGEVLEVVDVCGDELLGRGVRLDAAGQGRTVQLEHLAAKQSLGLACHKPKPKPKPKPSKSKTRE